MAAPSKPAPARDPVAAKCTGAATEQGVGARDTRMSLLHVGDPVTDGQSGEPTRPPTSEWARSW